MILKFLSVKIPWFCDVTCMSADLLEPDTSVVDNTSGGVVTGIPARATCQTPVVLYRRPASRHHLPGSGIIFYSAMGLQRLQFADIL